MARFLQKNRGNGIKCQVLFIILHAMSKIVCHFNSYINFGKLLIYTLRLNINWYFYFRELSLFAYITPQNSENSPFSMFNILESFGIKEPVRNITIGNTLNSQFSIPYSFESL